MNNKMSTVDSKLNKIGKIVIIERKDEIVLYSEIIDGASNAENYIWLILLFLFGVGFLTAGISSYFVEIRHYILFTQFSNITFLPQGILLLFYGTCSILLSVLIGLLIWGDIGSGLNIFDVESQVVRLSRKGFPNFTNNFTLKQKNIYLVYPFSEIMNIELEITNGLNPRRIIYLFLKDNRRIPLNPSNKLQDLLSLESKAIFIARLLKIDLKLNDK